VRPAGERVSPGRIAHASALALSAAVLLGVGTACARRDAPEDAATAVRALLVRQQAAWNRGDLETFLDSYWDSDSLTFYSGGTVQSGFAATRERYERRYQGEGREMGRLSIDLQQVTPLAPNVALVRAAWRLERSEDYPHGLVTLVVRRFPDGWKIVHDHSSAE
jgi:beta-aspartyl-peptidase (threonine type)